MESRKVVMKELKMQIMLAVPLTVANFLMFVLQLLSVVFVGHLNSDQLAGASMAISSVNVIGFAVLIGISCALETLCGQSYGAKQHKMVGIHLQRSALIITLLCFPLSMALAFSGHLLILIRQVPEIAMAAQSYARWMIPSLFAYGLIQCLMRFLQAQKIVFPIMLCSGAAALFHVLFCWVFTFRTALGYRGAALSISASYWLNLLLLVLYIRLSSNCRATWTGFSREAFHGLWSFLKLGIPSALMVCTRLSNELGAENPKAARLAVLVAASTVISEGLVVGSALIIGRSLWGRAYSSEAQVVDFVAAMMPWVAFSHLIDGFQCTLLGTVRGCGRQKIGAFVCLGSYYFIGIPMSILLGLVLHVGVKGLWIGNICAIFVQDLMLLFVTILTNWDYQVLKARKRVQNFIVPVDINDSLNEDNISV
ncbi:MATE efflux family protein 9 [Apostasia shenzhenica]|uniref:MATE efflux family protein 9 n=1 Tax=Apostasia shenzhenica TaxID=1088818 RepID=A0A2I0B1W5_9ASPA|nr:MATE efflux family protein 9 [Apostasia shenzhenica]